MQVLHGRFKANLRADMNQAALVIGSVRGSIQLQRGLVSAPTLMGCCTPWLAKPHTEGSGSPSGNGTMGHSSSQEGLQDLGGQTDGRSVQCSLKKPWFLWFHTKTLTLRSFFGYS